MIVVMQPEATEADVEGVTEALVRHGLVPSVSRGAEYSVIGAIGDVDAVGDLAQFSLLPGVDKTVRISAPYKLVAAREGHRRSTIRVGPSLIGGTSFAFIAGPCAVETPEQAAEACGATSTSTARPPTPSRASARPGSRSWPSRRPASACRWSPRCSTPRKSTP